MLSGGRNGKKDNKSLPAAVFFITTQPASVFHNPWEDSIDYSTGTAVYWGDAKYRAGHDIDQWKGNALLVKIYDLILRGDHNLCPPILYFIKEKKSEAVFKGICVIDSLEKTWFDDKGKRVINYRVNLTVLDIEKIDPEWLIYRAKNRNVDPEDVIVPDAWRRYCKTGYKNKLLVWSKRIKTKEQQIPSLGSPGGNFAKTIS